MGKLAKIFNLKKIVDIPSYMPWCLHGHNAQITVLTFLDSLHAHATKKDKRATANFTNTTFLDLFRFEDYQSDLVPVEKYERFFKGYVTPKLRELSIRHFDFNTRVQTQKRAWQLFNRDIRVEFPICRERREWRNAMCAYIYRYLNDHISRGRGPPNNPQLVQGIRHGYWGGSTSSTRELLSNHATIRFAAKTNSRDSSYTPGSTIGRIGPAGIPSSDTSDYSSVADFAEVTLFLQHCQPPLSHLLPTFVNLGIKTKAHLTGVAHWPENELQKVLKDFMMKDLLSWLEAKTLTLAFDHLRQHA